MSLKRRPGRPASGGESAVRYGDGCKKRKSHTGAGPDDR